MPPIEIEAIAASPRLFRVRNFMTAAEVAAWSRIS
jgi:hypothetical protein